LHGFGFGELIFDDCRIPADNRLGQEGDGLDAAYSSSILYGRPNLTAVALGIHRAIVEDTVRFCRERRAYGKSLGEVSAVNLKLGDMQSRLMTARLTAYHAANQLDLARPCDAELMNAKLVNVEYALDSARSAMEIFAARGLDTSFPIERYLRDANHIYAPPGPRTFSGCGWARWPPAPTVSSGRCTWPIGSPRTRPRPASPGTESLQDVGLSSATEPPSTVPGLGRLPGCERGCPVREPAATPTAPPSMLAPVQKT
jgi:hypothetical protein